MTERQIEAIEARVRELELEAVNAYRHREPESVVSSMRLVAVTLAELARAMRAVQEGTP